MDLNTVGATRMSEISPQTFTFSKAQLSQFLDSTGSRFLDQGKNIGEGDMDYARMLLVSFIGYAGSDENIDAYELGDTPKRQQLAACHAIPIPGSPKSERISEMVSSVGKILTTQSPNSSGYSESRSLNLIKYSQVAPLEMAHTQKSMAQLFLSSPEVTQYVEEFFKDVEKEDEIARQMDNVLQKYSAKEDEAISSAKGLIVGMKLKGAIPFTDFKATFSSTRGFKGFFNSKMGDIYAEAYYTVRGDHQHVAARIFNYHSCCKNPAFIREHVVKQESSGDHSYLEVPNAHSSVYSQYYHFPSPLSDRDFICNIVWKRLSDNTIIVTYHPLPSHPQVEDSDGEKVIRGSMQVVYQITQLEDGLSEVQYGFHVNFGGNLPKVAVYGYIIPNANRSTSHHQVYFANSLTLEDLSKKDGKLLGEILVNQMKRARKRGGWKKYVDLGKIGVDEFLYCSLAMRELLPKHPWLRALLHEISLNQVKVAGTVHTPLSDMKDQDAVQLARGLSTIILSNTEASAAVDHWIAQNAALEEFEKDHEWMRSFFVEIAQYNLNTSNLGLRLRVFGGALLSTVDLVTDVYMTVQFFNTPGEEGYGKTNAVLIGLTLFIQLIVAYSQNSTSKHFFQDAFFILTGFKPALDAYRVGSGAEQEDHQTFAPLMEMTLCKAIETVFEAVPSSAVQIYALLSAKEKSIDALISIFVSAATIAFTSSMITYDWDTSPTNRTGTPLFYGFLPDKALPRAVCFLSMMSLSFAHVLLLTSACALLALTNPNWLLLFLGVDIGLFFLYKIMRGDFFYFLNVDGFVRLVTAIMVRFTAKTMVNFTMLMQLRHPQELGGLPFLVSILTSVVGSFVSVHVYSTYYNEDVKLEYETLQTVLGSLVAIWFVSAVTLALFIKRGYLHTFYGMDTASTFNRKAFLHLREDQDLEKSEKMRRHPDIYMAWGDELIKPWTINNWNRWEEEKPAWFTDNWIEAVPNEYIPFEWRVKYKKTKGRVDDTQLQRRRGSISVHELVGGKEER